MFKIKPIFCERCFSCCNVLIYPVIDNTLPLNMVRVSCPCCFSDVTSFNVNRAVMKWNHLQVKLRKEFNNV